MNPCEVSARFAAYVWCTGRQTARPTAEGEAVRFARANWRAFLGCAHEGLGKLPIRIASGRQGRRNKLASVGAAG